MIYISKYYNTILDFTGKQSVIPLNYNEAKFSGSRYLLQSEYEIIKKRDGNKLTGIVECDFYLNHYERIYSQQTLEELQNNLVSICHNGAEFYNNFLNTWEVYDQMQIKNYLIRDTNNTNLILIRARWTNPDYCGITVQFYKTPTKIVSENNYLNNNYFIFLKGFSPTWNSNSIDYTKTLFLLKKDDSNYLKLVYDKFDKRFKLIKCVDEYIFQTQTNPYDFKNFTMFNIIVQNTIKGIELHILRNNSIPEISLKNDVVLGLSGNMLFYPLQDINNYADAFIEEVYLVDLDKMNKNHLNSQEISDLLYCKKDNLLNSKNYNIYDYNKIQGQTQDCIVDKINKTLSIISPKENKSLYSYLQVIPSNKYQISCNKTNKKGCIKITQFFNSNNLKTIELFKNKEGEVTDLIILEDFCNNLKISCTNDNVLDESFIFKDIDFQIKM